MATRISALCLTAILMLAAAAVAAQEDPVLGQTGDYVVKKSDVERLLVFYPLEAQQRLRENAAEMEVLVKRMLEVKIIADVARKEKFDQQAQIKKQLDYVVDDFLSKEYLLKVVTQDVVVSEADLKAFYDQNKARLGAPEQVRARHILFHVDPASSEDEKRLARARAEAVLERAKAGEDFEKLARDHSDDQSSKAKGGDLGYFGPGRMVPDFEGVAFYTDPGQISEIVETKYGYHIIKVEDRKEGRERSFEEVKDYIKEQVVAFKVKEFIRKTAESAGMRVFADRIAGK